MRKLLWLLFTIHFVTIVDAQVASALIDFNGISATINASGLLFHNPTNASAGFEYPKGSGKHLIFSMSDWYAGVDNFGDLRMAASEGQLFHPHENGDFSPGPLQVNPTTGWPPLLEPFGPATTNSNAMQEYNNVWVARKSEIDSFLIWINSAIPPNWPGYTIPNSILEWPAHGDITDQFSYYLAPFVDVNSDGTYDPLGSGDYPDIKGDFCAFTIYNDNGGAHQVTGTEPLGLEIHQLVYGFSPDPSCSNYDVLNATLFVNRRIINRSTVTYTDFSMGIFLDPDIGSGADDFVGCDVNRSMIYSYNGDDLDEGPNGYGANVPALGVVILEGIKQDPTGIDDSIGVGINQSINGFGFENGIIDDEKLGLTGFTPIDGPMTSINSADERFNLLNGNYVSGTPFLSPSGETNFIFPDSSNTFGYLQAGNVYPPWSEITAGSSPGSRRVVGASGNCSLGPGQYHEVKFAIVAGPPTNGSINSVAALQTRVDTIRTIHNLSLEPCSQLGIPEESEPVTTVYPNPASTFVQIEGVSVQAEAIVYNPFGVIVKTFVGCGELRIDDLPSGLYLISVTDKGQTTIHRFIKE